MLQLEDLPIRDSEKPQSYDSIRHDHESSYEVIKDGVCYCSCRTFEQAYYVQREFNKCDWDKTKLSQILNEYPIFYTDLLEFYYRITQNKKKSSLKWILSIPSDKSDKGVVQYIRYSRLEDALFERDFLLNNNWDYELLVEQIDDRANPYYNRQLPPFPQRKVRSVRRSNNHRKELEQIIEIIKKDPYKSQYKISKEIGVSDLTIRNWLHQYNTCWSEFKGLILNDVNPLDVLKFNRHIYTPNLSVDNYKGNGHVFYREDMVNKYIIRKNNVYYGSYPNESLARKIVHELEKCDWDKSKLPSIRREWGL